MSVRPSSPLDNAIAHIRQHREVLLEQVRECDAALSALSNIAGVPASAPAVKRPASVREVTPSAPSYAHARQSGSSEAPRRKSAHPPADEAVAGLLARGPITVGAFRRAFQLNPFVARKHLSSLEARGIVTLDGVKSARRVRLAEARPPKEAP